MKRLNVPYPSIENEETKKAKSIPVMTTIKPNGWIMNDPVPQYKFTSHLVSESRVALGARRKRKALPIYQRQNRGVTREFGQGELLTDEENDTFNNRIVDRLIMKSAKAIGYTCSPLGCGLWDSTSIMT